MKYENTHLILKRSLVPEGQETCARCYFRNKNCSKMQCMLGLCFVDVGGTSILFNKMQFNWIKEAKHDNMSQ